MKQIHGDRICQQCKGICHENSLRTTFGQRRKYFCSEQCLRTFKGADDWTWPEADDDWKHVVSGYERVEVISK